MILKSFLQEDTKIGKVLLTERFNKCGNLSVILVCLNNDSVIQNLTTLISKTNTSFLNLDVSEFSFKAQNAI